MPLHMWPLLPTVAVTCTFLSATKHFYRAGRIGNNILYGNVKGQDAVVMTL